MRHKLVIAVLMYSIYFVHGCREQLPYVRTSSELNPLIDMPEPLTLHNRGCCRRVVELKWMEVSN